jgi:hypothetical protein
MICRKFQRRLEFESLESMQLLSGAGLISARAMANHHAVHQAPPAPTQVKLLALSGVVRGTYHVTGGTVAVFTGRGPLIQVGTTQLRATIEPASFGSGQVTLSVGRRGKLFVDVTSAVPEGALTYEVFYQITGGTRSFAGDIGAGFATVQLSGLQPRGHFTLSFQA